MGNICGPQKSKYPEMKKKDKKAVKKKKITGITKKTSSDEESDYIFKQIQDINVLYEFDSQSDLLGQGTNSSVYKATHKETNMKCALKVVYKDNLSY